MAAALRGLGVELENRMVLCLPDSPAFLAAYFGALRAGALPVLVNTYAGPAEYACDPTTAAPRSWWGTGRCRRARGRWRTSCCGCDT
ncbi:MAG: hypothetical protein C4303_02510 [candidate division GAL15 bacterium]